jgi:hypothetical protein
MSDKMAVWKGAMMPTLYTGEEALHGPLSHRRLPDAFTAAGVVAAGVVAAGVVAATFAAAVVVGATLVVGFFAGVLAFVAALTGMALSATPTINVVPIAKSRVNFMDPPGEFASEGLPERVDSFVKLVTSVKLTPTCFARSDFDPMNS